MLFGLKNEAIMESKFVPTPHNMVKMVENIIEGYGEAGAVRALAQEPVQNAKDAKQGQIVRVEYRLHARKTEIGRPYYVLTVTDSGTHGLRGPVYAPKELQERGYNLKDDENWAAFEGQGFTKSNRDSVGSRGQGKSAFLYHSKAPSSKSSRHMAMLYDTLLKNGEYRFGARIVNPADTIQHPPYYNGNAREIVSSQYKISEDATVDLRLEPLTNVGTRVIVPFLSDEAVSAVESGDLAQWLERCWWRLVQIKKLEITVVGECGKSCAVQTPGWWKDEPWKKNPNRPGRYAATEFQGDLVQDRYKIKRIALLYDESLIDDPDLEDVDPQYKGVQLLRGGQWIETLDCRDYIPRERRLGFRGFVEFDKKLERELRDEESSQHHRFYRRKSFVKDAIKKIHERVEEFAMSQGWGATEKQHEVPVNEEETVRKFFLAIAPTAKSKSGRGGVSPSPSPVERWDCALNLKYPNSRTTRVNWGDRICSVSVSVKLHPAPENASKRVAVSLSLIGPDSRANLINKQEIAILDGSGAVPFGDFLATKNHPGPNELRCPEAGKWRLKASVNADGVEVCSASRTLYVNEDPLERLAPKLYSVSISAQNISDPEKIRIDSGEVVEAQISVINRALKSEEFEINASFGDVMLADGLQVEVLGTPAGDSLQKASVCSRRIVVNPDSATDGFDSSLIPVRLDPGRHFIRADLVSRKTNEVVDHKSYSLYIDADRPRPSSGLPFQIKQRTIENQYPCPRWDFDKKSDDEWTLLYSPDYPIYREMSSNSANSSSNQAFIVEICSEAMIEWALEPLHRGDESRLEDLRRGASYARVSGNGWLDDYLETLNNLADLRSQQEPVDVDQYSRLARLCASQMMRLFEIA